MKIACLYVMLMAGLAVGGAGCGGGTRRPSYLPKAELSTRWAAEAKFYGVSERCSQGPLVLTMPALGSTWGEIIEITAHGGAIEGSYDVWVGGERVRQGWAVHTDDERGRPVPAAREHCLLPTTPKQGQGGWTPQLPPSQGGGFGGGSSLRTTSFISMNQPSVLSQSHASVSYRKDVRAWGEVGLRAGAQISFVFYSDLPNDFSKVTFKVNHGALEPPDHEAYKQELWTAKLRLEADQAALEARGRQCALNMDAACRAEGWRYASEVPPDRPSVAPVGFATAVSASKTPTVPPPAARVEVVPPKPTAGSVWVNGYYVWDGYVWVWASGAYRIPPEDLRPPPSPPPPPPVAEPQRPPSGGPFAQWVVGRWVFTATGWVWLAGRFQ